MPTYKVFEVVGAVEAVEAQEAGPMGIPPAVEAVEAVEGVRTHVNTIVAEPEFVVDMDVELVPEAEAPARDRRITRLAFLNRFTDAEAIAFDLGSMGATPQAAAMRRYMNKVNAAMHINLDLPETRAGVEALEAGGLLAAGRADAILDGAIAEAERFKD